MTRNLIWAALAVAASIPLAARADDAAQAEVKRLEGTWQLVSGIKDGQETPAEVVAKIRVVIQNGKHTVYFGDQPAVKDIPFTADPTKNPGWTTDTLPDGTTILGIYRLEGDRLTSCVAPPGQPRPQEFASKPGSGHTLRVFKRVKL